MLRGFPFWVSFSSKPKERRILDLFHMLGLSVHLSLSVSLCPMVSLSLFCGPDPLFHSLPNLTPASSIYIQNITSQKQNTETSPLPGAFVEHPVAFLCFDNYQTDKPQPETETPTGNKEGKKAGKWVSNEDGSPRPSPWWELKSPVGKSPILRELRHLFSNTQRGCSGVPH